MTPRRRLPRLLFPLLPLVSACTGNTVSTRAELAARNGPLRAPSLQPFLALQVDALPRLRWLTQRTACVLEHADTLDFAKGPDGSTLRYGGFLDGTLTTTTFGAAAPISDDGYFLTAAHCVAQEPVLVIGAAGAGPVRETAAVVIWRGDPDQRDGDLAVLFAPGLATPALAWSTPAPPAGTLVLCCGAGTTAVRAAGGTILAGDQVTTQLVDGPAVTTIGVAVPVVPGDSGGPCVLADGTLLGVTVRAATGTAPTGTVLRPDPAWITALLARDRAARASTPAPKSRPSTAGTMRTMAIDAEVEALLPKAR